MITVVSELSDRFITYFITYINLVCFLPDMLIPLTFLISNRNMKENFCFKRRTVKTLNRELENLFVNRIFVISSRIDRICE